MKKLLLFLITLTTLTNITYGSFPVHENFRINIVYEKNDYVSFKNTEKINLNIKKKIGVRDLSFFQF